MRYFRIFVYILLVAVGMVSSFFITAFILEQLDITRYVFNWWLAEGITVGIIGFLVALFAPRIVDGFLWLVNDASVRISNHSTKELVGGGLGLIIGLLVAFLISLPIGNLPFGGIISVIIIIFLGYTGLQVGLRKKEDLAEVFRFRLNVKRPSKTEKKHYLGILDTSAIIDGRFADVYRTGFLDGTFILPNFVLDELKRVADNSDLQKKERGRRGLNILNELKEQYPNAYEMTDRDFDDVKEVDTKIIHLAVELKTRIFTNDYNLNRMAQVQNVTVLNINDLANAVKSIVLPGEELLVHIIKEGKENNQGVAYLDDGTMIVVENGKKYVGVVIQVVVTSVLQTSNGKMIFARPQQ